MNLKPYPKYKDSGIEWLGEIPEGWEVKRLKYVCNEYAEYGLNIEAENYQSEGIRFIRTTDVDDCGNLRNEGVYINPILAKDYILKDGDLLISRSGTIGRSFLYESSKNKEATYAGYLVRYSLDSEKAFPKYLFYFTLSYSFYEWLKTQLIESTIGNVNGQKYANIFLPIPPKEEQIRLSTFLDQKTSKIDELIKKNETLIELLKEKRQAIISQAVTKGLDPNAKLKDSGIEWIGKIPEGWEVKKIKHTSYIKGRVGWHGLRSDEFTDEGHYLVTGTDFIGDKVNWETCYHISDERYNQDLYIQLRENDLLITKDGTIGKVALVKNLPDKATLNSGIMLIRPITKDYCTDFMFWILNSKVFSEYNEHTKTGSTIQHLYQETFENFIFSVPRIDEQKSICIYLTQKTAHVDESIQKIQSQIQTLKEYRQALISNVVTGKVKVY